MKKSIKMYLITFILALVLAPVFYAQGNENDKGKSFYTSQEVKQMCGVPVDTLIMKKVLAKQDSMYKHYKEEKKSKLNKVTTIPNWQSMMSIVENQGACGSCWVHAATGIIEGQLHILYGSRIGNSGIDLDESDIPGACNRGFPTEAEDYIQTNKIGPEVGSYPNLGNTKWDIISYSTISGITAIKNALENGPVAACFYVFADFSPFFTSNPTDIYRYDGQSVLEDAHAVVIVSYDEDNEYWLCKNSWGSDWADGGYFRIGYGECGIDSWENSVVTVNSSCYGKITPNLIPNLSTALNYSFVNDELAYVIGNYTLSSNAFVSSNATVKVNSDATVNLVNGSNRYSIISTGGTIIDNGTINGVRAKIKNGSTLKGLCGTIESAINAASSGYTVEIANGTINESFSIYGKDDITITGSGTTLTGTQSFYWCDNLEFWGLTASQINAYYCTNPWFYNEIYGSLSGTGLGVYNCTNFYICGGVYNCNTGINAYATTGCATGDINYNNTSVSSWSGANVEVSLAGLCSSINYDFSVTSSGYITSVGSRFASLPPRIYNSGGTTSISGAMTCGMAKVSGAEAAQNDISPVPIQSENPVESEFSKINSSYFTLLKTIRENKEKGIQDNGELKNQWLNNVNDFRSFIDKNPQSSLARVALTTTANSFSLFEDNNGMKIFLDEIINDKELASLKGKAGILMIDYYSNIEDFEKAISTANDFIDNYKSESDLSCEVLLKKGLILLHRMNQPLKAIECFTTIVNDNPSNPLVELAINELRILGKQVEADDSKKLTKTENSQLDVNNYPNPFNPTTKISFTLPQSSKVSLKVYDMLGREVANLADEVFEAGTYEREFDASNLASGIYFYTIKTTLGTISKKMLLVK